MPPTPRLEPSGGSGAPLLQPAASTTATPPASAPPPPLASWAGAVADVTVVAWDAPRASLSKKSSPSPPPGAVALDVASGPSSDGGSSSDASTGAGQRASITASTAGLWRRASGPARRRASARVAPSDGLATRADSSTSSLASSSSSSAMPYVPASRSGGVNHRSSSKASVFDVASDRVAPWCAALAARVDGLPAVAAVAAVTLVSNFMDDVRLAFLPRGADRVCEAVAAAIFAVFAVDTILGCLARPGYPLRLFFWVDLAATASMLLEVPSLMLLVTGRGAPGPAGASVLARGVPDTPDQRARQILRVLRILRLLRVVKLVQLYQAHRDAAALEQELAGTPTATTPATARSAAHARASTFFPTTRPSWLRSWCCTTGSPRARPWWTAPPRRSRVAQRLSDLSASRVVVGVLALLLAIPGFNINSGIYGDYPPFAVGGLTLLAGECRLATNNGAIPLPVPPPPAVDTAASSYAEAAAYKLVGRTTSTVLELTACNATLVASPGAIAARRPQELAVLSSRSSGCVAGGVCLVTTAVLDVRWNSQVSGVESGGERGNRGCFFSSLNHRPSPPTRSPPCSTSSAPCSSSWPWASASTSSNATPPASWHAPWNACCPKRARSPTTRSPRAAPSLTAAAATGTGSWRPASWRWRSPKCAACWRWGLGMRAQKSSPATCGRGATSPPSSRVAACAPSLASATFASSRTRRRCCRRTSWNLSTRSPRLCTRR